MKPFSIVAIYVLFWVISAFFVMPFGLRTPHEEHDDPDFVPGQAQSAPVNFRPGRIAIRTTIVATLLFGLFYANYVKGWVTIDDINPIHPPASLMKSPY